MLLDRKRVKFWQKWIFGIMALLMAGFLVMIPLNRTACGQQTAATDSLQKDIKRYEAAVKADPKNVQAWRNLADAYVGNVSAQHQQGVTLTDQQTTQLKRAALAYRKADRLLSKQKGPAAKAERLDTLEVLASVYNSLGDYQAEAGVYGDLTSLKPRNADYFFGLGNAGINAGDTKGALLAFQRFLELAPNDPAAPDVKDWIKQNAPSPAPTKGTAQ